MTPTPESTPVWRPQRAGRRLAFSARSASLTLGLALPAALHAQISLTSAVDLALRSSPRVKSAEADVAKAQALLAQARDIYIPSVTVGAGLGNSYGYSPNPPTLFTSTAQSLVYSSSQFDYIRSSRAALKATQLAMDDVREAVAEDTALTFAALEHDQQRLAVLHQQLDFAARLTSVVQDRFDAGQDSAIDLTTARLTAAQFRLATLRAEDDTANDRTHLAALIGLPGTQVNAEGEFPGPPAGLGAPITTASPQNGAVAAAFATARARQQQAWGDNRFLYRPQLSLFLQYSRYATFTDSFLQLNANRVIGSNISGNYEAYGVQINIPIFDKVRQAHARETAADAARALHDAQTIQMNALDGASRLSHTIVELRSRSEVATLEQQLAQQQLDALLVQLSASPASGAPILTPKDEQNSRIAEREKYLGVVDATFQLRQAEINLMRQTGQLEEWLLSSLRTTTKPTP